MSNAPAPIPGLTVSPATSWIYHEQTASGTGVVTKDGDGDKVHYHLTASGPYGFSGEVTSWTTPTHLPPFGHPNGTMIYTLVSNDDFGEGSSITKTGLVRLTQPPSGTITVKNPTDIFHPYIRPWTLIETKWSTSDGNRDGTFCFLLIYTYI